MERSAELALRWQVRTNLRGLTHAELITGAVRAAGVFPRILLLDGAAAWNGAHAQAAEVFDLNERVIIPVPDGEPPAVFEHVSRVASTANTPVERQWREVNKATNKFRCEFLNLERVGQLVRSDPIHLFCLTRTYLDAVRNVVDHHMIAARRRVRPRTSSNPFLPPRRQRRCVLHTMRPQFGIPVDEEMLAAIDAAGREYWADDEPSPWEIEPVRRAARPTRAAALEALDAEGALPSLAARFVALRATTEWFLWLDAKHADRPTHVYEWEVVDFLCARAREALGDLAGVWQATDGAGWA